MWQLGLALTCDVSCQDHEGVTERTSWRWGAPRGIPWRTSVSSKCLSSKVVEWNYYFFQSSEHRAQQTVAQTQGGGSRNVLPHAHCSGHSGLRDAFALSRPLSTRTARASISALSTSWSCFVVVQPQFTVKPQSIFLAFIGSQLSQHLETWLFFYLDTFLISSSLLAGTRWSHEGSSLISAETGAGSTWLNRNGHDLPENLYSRPLLKAWSWGSSGRETDIGQSVAHVRLVYLEGGAVGIRSITQSAAGNSEFWSRMTVRSVGRAASMPAPRFCR